MCDETISSSNRVRSEYGPGIPVGFPLVELKARENAVISAFTGRLYSAPDELSLPFPRCFDKQEMISRCAVKP